MNTFEHSWQVYTDLAPDADGHVTVREPREIVFRYAEEAPDTWHWKAFEVIEGERLLLARSFRACAEQPQAAYEATSIVTWIVKGGF